MMKEKYQWQVADMRKAGLNPILAAGATPGMGSTTMAQTIPLNLGATAKSALRMSDELQILGEEAEAAQYETERKGYASVLEQQKIRNAREVNSLTRAQADKLRIETKLLSTDIPAAEAQEQFDKTRPGHTLRWIRRASEALQGLRGTGPRR